MTRKILFAAAIVQITCGMLFINLRPSAFMYAVFWIPQRWIVQMALLSFIAGLRAMYWVGRGKSEEGRSDLVPYTVTSTLYALSAMFLSLFPSFYDGPPTNLYIVAALLSISTGLLSVLAPIKGSLASEWFGPLRVRTWFLIMAGLSASVLVPSLLSLGTYFMAARDTEHREMRPVNADLSEFTLSAYRLEPVPGKRNAFFIQDVKTGRDAGNDALYWRDVWENPLENYVRKGEIRSVTLKGRSSHHLGGSGQPVNSDVQYPFTYDVQYDATSRETMSIEIFKRDPDRKWECGLPAILLRMDNTERPMSILHYVIHLTPECRTTGLLEKKYF